MKPETKAEQKKEKFLPKRSLWRSLDEQDAELKRDPNLPYAPAAEFDASPIKQGFENDGTDGGSRREFLKIMGASIAMLGASACTRRPVEKIVPYVKKPDDVIPGVANYYASTCGECDSACGILVKTREGRPIKFEGNPKHPSSQGALCARGQASVLNLYDPDRLQGPIEPGRNGAKTAISWEQLDSKVVSKLRRIRESGKQVRVLTGEINSPSTARLIEDFVKGVGGRHVTYEPLASEEVLVASEICYGSRAVPHYHFEKSELVVSFGADFLGSWLSPVEFGKAYSKTRKLGANAGENKVLSRFYAFESLMTLTGSNADERYRVKSGDEYKAALALAHELIVTQGHSKFAGNSDIRGVLSVYEPAAIASKLGIPAAVFGRVARDLWENRDRSIVVGGGHSAKGDDGVALEVAVNLLNSALDNEGTTIDGTASPYSSRSSFPELQKLLAEMKSGQVGALLIYNSNPVYALPKTLGFEQALAKVDLVVDFAMSLDETGKCADAVATTSHHTETWGDASPYAGVVSIQQPTIAPLYKTRSFEDSLMTWAKQLHLSGAIASAPSWHEYLRGNWRETIYKQFGSGPFDLFWDHVLRDGLVDSYSARRGSNTKPRAFAAGALRGLPRLTWTTGTTLVLYPSTQYDGRMSNNGWLQELPDPVTKVTWDNYASMSPAMAKSLGVTDGDVVRVKTKDATVEVPAHVQVGMPDQSIGIALGYGRTSAGRVGDGVGVDAFPLGSLGKQTLALSGLAATVEKTGRTYDLALTQKHHSLEGRDEDILRQVNYEEFKKNPKSEGSEEENPSLWPKHDYSGYRWAMAIDLSSCTGCSACVVACQAENNIPVVGKKFVMTSREMHWLRIDRYYSGMAESPKVAHQPMMCQHCENAPCETVCPVLATMHDHEGINQQVYNRCVGTRYCENNCPYKVRRFNWFTFTEPGYEAHGLVKHPMELVYNPDVTVRTRGIMEKCTFCIERVRSGKDDAKDHGTRVKDGDIKTACQQSCPADAIVFGDINDPNSRVAKISADPRGYRALNGLNTKPSITYLSKITNGTTTQRSES